MLRQIIASLSLVASLVSVVSMTFVPRAQAAPAAITPSTTNAIDGLPLSPPSAPKSHFSDVIGWKKNEKPHAPTGFTVIRFAEGLKSPRWIYSAPNGDVFISEAATRSGGGNRISIYRDKDGDGQFETHGVYLTGLNQPFGMLVVGNAFYVGLTDALMRYPYDPSTLKLTSPGTKLVDLPAGGYNNHWTRNLVLAKDGKHILITVGSGSNVGENGMENEIRRANILEVDLDGKAERILASGLRNPVGLAYASDGTPWVAVNERDNLGDDLVPDYLTSVRDGGFYGWPYSYFGKNEDPRMKGQRPDLVAKAIVPDVALGSHTASLGLAFYNATSFPAKYHGGAFIGQHGSWNHSTLVGYRVAFVPFSSAGRPTAKPEDFLTGFIANASKFTVHGRPVGVTVLPKDGSLLVADDEGNIVWRVTPTK